MTILEKIKFEEEWLSEVNLTKENIKIAFAGIRATVLEQQPCDDCVSRKAVNMLSIDLVYITGDKADFLCKFWTGLDALPSVTPKQKVSEWIDMKYKDEWWCPVGKCLNCGEEHILGSNYCPNCGAKMNEESKTAQALVYADQDTLMPAT